jgi:hypothetical protein
MSLLPALAMACQEIGTITLAPVRPQKNWRGVVNSTRKQKLFL